MVYFFYFLVNCVLLAPVFFLKKRGIWYASIFSVFIFLFVFSGFRFDVGTDYPSYDASHEEYFESGETEFEPGYNAILKLGSLADSSRLVFLLAAGLTAAFSVAGIVRFSCAPALSLMIYVALPLFYIASFNSVRQSIAISIFLFSLRFLSERKFLMYSSLIVLATLFHKSAILLLPLYFLLVVNLGLLALLLLLLLFWVFSFFYVDLFLFLGFSDKYFSGYFGPPSFDYRILGLLFLAAIARILMPISYRNDIRFRVSLNTLFVCCALYFLGYFSGLSNLVTNRFLSYFFISIIFVAPFLILYFKGVLERAVLISFCFILAWGYFFSVILLEGQGYNLVPFGFRVTYF